MPWRQYSGFRRGEKKRSCLGFRRGSRCAPATSIRSPIRACPVMPGAGLALSTATMASSRSWRPVPMVSATSRSTCIRSGFRRASCGASRRRRRIASTWIYMTTTLNLSDSAGVAERLAALPRLPRDNGGPVFAEPWQAQAFALAVKLSEQGHFSWTEWAAVLAAELKAAADRGEPDDGSHYYDHWLAALERLLTAKGLTDASALLARKEAWADAYRHTPHGKPVELRAASAEPEHT